MANEGLVGGNFFKDEYVGIDAAPVSRGDRHEGSPPPVKTAFLTFNPKRFIKNQLCFLSKSFSL
jgi:hypothetical protein